MARAARADEVAAQLRSVLVPLHRTLRRQRGDLLTATQASVLGSVARNEPIGLSDLAACERLSAPMITKVVRTLERLGLLERVRDPDDGRAWQVRLSASGRTWLKRTRDRRDRWLSERLAALDAAELDAIATALPALSRIVGDDQ